MLRKGLIIVLLLSLVHHCLQRVSRQVWWLDEALLVRRMWSDDCDWRIFTQAALRSGMGWEMAALLEQVGRLPGVELPSRLLSLLRTSSKGPSNNLSRLRGSRGWATIQNALSLRGWRKVSYIFERMLRILAMVVTGGRSDPDAGGSAGEESDEIR